MFLLLSVKRLIKCDHPLWINFPAAIANPISTSQNPRLLRYILFRKVMLILHPDSNWDQPCLASKIRHIQSGRAIDK